MTIGFMGLGKLGLPVALCVESKGYKVLGHDKNSRVAQSIIDKEIPFVEKDIDTYLENTEIEMVSTETLVKDSDLIFCAVQTPHDKEYEGVTRIPEKRVDFDYSYLMSAVEEINEIAEKLKKPTKLAIISTVLPGTTKQYIKPLCGEYIKLVYTPQFIAMGTVIHDYLNPEFNLIGVDDSALGYEMRDFYKTINDAPPLLTDITTAEGIKVSYNTIITAKTVLANLWGELSQKLGMNVDDIHKAWSLSTNRLLSPKYLKAGVGDGGGCHPRDNIALSYLAEQTKLSFNIFDSLMKARENHMDWIAEMVEYAYQNKRKHNHIVILGRSFKPETNIETGSSAILLANLLKERGLEFEHIDPIEIDVPKGTLFSEGIYVLGTAHDIIGTFNFASESIVIDPFGIVDDQPDVEVVRLGRP